MTTPEDASGPPPKISRRRVSREKTPSEPTVDPLVMLARLLSDAAISQNPQSDEERTPKLTIAEEDADHERTEKKKAADHRRELEKTALVALLAIAALICPVCLWVLADKSVPSEQKQWAAPLLTFILGGLIGFLTGRVPSHPPQK